MTVIRHVLTLIAVLAAFPALAAVISGRASVMDGDTIEVGGQRVKLYGIDAPEGTQQCWNLEGNAWWCGREAAAALADFTAGKTVHCKHRDTDFDGQVFAVCSVENIDIGAWLVRQGLALAYRPQSMDYVELEDAARQSGQGVWQGIFSEPWRWRQGLRFSVYSPSDHVDRDCADFETWEEAQALYEASRPGDRYGLDWDNDGNACELLQRWPEAQRLLSGFSSWLYREVITESVLMMILGVLSAGYGTYTLGDWIFNLRRARRSLGWPRATGRILKSEYSKNAVEDEPLHGVNVSYEYEVDGVRYESDRYSFGGHFTSKHEDEALYLHRCYLPIGKEIPVYYDPEQPAFSVLEPGVRLNFMWGGLLFMLLGVLSFVIGFTENE